MSGKGEIERWSSDHPLSVSCLCGKTRATFKLPESSFPQLELCHCTTCRHQSGQLATFVITIPSTHTSTFEIQGPLTSYQTSKSLTRYHCSSCGANVYFNDHSHGLIEVWAGLLDQMHLLRSYHQIFLSDTRDGGMSVWFPDTPLWSEWPDESEKVDISTYTSAKSPPNQIEDRSDFLSCHCHCGGITFRIAAPPKHSKDFPATFSAGPYPDLLVPHVEKSPLQPNRDNEPWFLRPVSDGNGNHNTKYLAGLCACRSCRKASGGVFQAFAFIPRHLILSAHSNDILDLEALRLKADATGHRAGTLKTYNSSPNTYRDFCSGCGATVFWRSDERKDVVDVSVGLIDAASDVRAETWLDWYTDRISFEEGANDEPILTTVKDGLRARRHGS